MITLVVITGMTPVGYAWAESEGTGFGTWSGSLGFGYARATQTTQSASTKKSESTNQLFLESLQITNHNFSVINPRLWTGNLGLALALNQNKSQSEGSGTASEDKLIGYSCDSTFFAKKPVVTSVYANRNQSQSLQTFGGHREGLTESRGASFQLHEDSVLKDWGFPWFSSNLSLHSDSSKTKTSIFGQSMETEETGKTLEFNASKGFETADLGLSYSFNEQSNMAFSQGNQQSRSAGLVYSLDFGPNLNRRFDTNSSYLTRNGSTPSSTSSTTERLHIDHYQNLSTDYFYGLTRLDAGGAISTMQNGGFTVAHQLYQNLNTTAGVSGNRGTLPNGSNSSYGGQIGQGYHHSLPRKGVFSANWGGSYQLNSNNLTSSRISVIDVTQKVYGPFDPIQSLTLNNSFAVPSSIQVWNLQGGGRTLVDPLNYDVSGGGGSPVQITFKPTYVFLYANDPLEVDYDYQVDQNLKYESKSKNFGLGVDYGWIGTAFSHQQSEQNPLSGNASSFLLNSRQDNVLVSSRGTFLGMPVQASMDFIQYTSNTSAYDRRKFASALIRETKSNIRMVFSLNSSETQYTLPTQHQNTSLSAHTTLDWYAWGGWVNSASADWSRFSDSGAPTMTLMQAGVRSSRTLGKLSLAASARFSESLRSDVRSTDLSFNINAMRSF